MRRRSEEPQDLQPVPVLRELVSEILGAAEIAEWFPVYGSCIKEKVKFGRNKERSTHTSEYAFGHIAGT